MAKYGYSPKQLRLLAIAARKRAMNIHLSHATPAYSKHTKKILLQEVANYPWFKQN